MTSHLQSSSSRFANWLAAAVCLLILLHFGWRFASTAANVAFADDIVDALWFFEIFRQTPELWPRLATLLLPNHEHILLFDHLVYVLYYALAGELNFLHFVLLGNLSLPWLAWLMWRWARDYVPNASAWVLAIGLTFQLFSAESNFYSIASLSTKFVFIFAMMAFLHWARRPEAIWWPLVWALLAITIQFNGLLTLPVLVLVTLIYGVASHRWPLKQLLVWAVLGLGLILAYVAYESPLTMDHLARQVQATDADKAHEFARNVAEWQKQMVQLHAGLTLWDYFERFIASMLVLVGATLWPNQWSFAVIGAQITGLMMFAGFGWLIYRGWWRNPFWLALSLWVMASLLMLAIGRGMNLGEQAGMVSRYRYYSFLLLWLLIVPFWQLYAQRLSHTLQVAVVSALALLVSVAGVGEWRAAAEMIERVQTSYRYLLVDGGLNRSQMPFYPHNLDRRLLNAQNAGYFSMYKVLPQGFKPATIADWREVCPEQRGFDQAISAFSKNRRALAVELTLELVPAASGDEILFCGAERAVLLGLTKQQRAADSARYLPQVVLKSELAPAHYRVYARQRGSDDWQAIGVIDFP